MTTPEFNKVVEDQLDRIRNVLVKKAAEYNLYELDEIKEGLENVRDTLFQKGYDIDKFIHYQNLYRTMTIKEYVEFLKTL